MGINLCTIIGILDDGWAGLSQNAKEKIIAADVIIGAGRVLALLKNQINTSTQVLNLDQNLSSVPQWINSALAQNQKVVTLATGDPLCFGIAKMLISKLGEDKIEIMPTTSTMFIAFAKLKLNWENFIITSIHSGVAEDWFFGAPPKHGLYNLIQKIAHNPAVAFFTSPANNPAKVARSLINAGFENIKISIACKLLQNEEIIYPNLNLQEVANKDFPSPNIMVVQHKITTVNRSTIGINDEDFLQRFPEKGLITKQEVRLLSLAKMAITKHSIVWDIGAGSGALGITAAMFALYGHTFAIEKNLADFNIALTNGKKFGLTNWTIINATAPQGIGENWLCPDAIFIGGSGGELVGLINLCLQKLKIGGRLVMNFVTFENLTTTITTLKTYIENISWEIVQLQASRSQPILNMNRLSAQNPVWVITVHKLLEIN